VKSWSCIKLQVVLYEYQDYFDVAGLVVTVMAMLDPE
jgi:hypothetical protein